MTNQLQLSPVKKILKTIASMKLTVVCLLILVVLVVWGTVYQADHGLYQAQQKFFHSWFFLAFGFFPLPGTVLVMFVLFFNLVCSIFFRIGFRWSKVGAIITHLGIVVLLVGGFFTFYFSVESSLMIREGETTNASFSRQLWELVVWERPASEMEVDVFHVDTKGLDTGDTIQLEKLGLVLETKEYHENCTHSRDAASGTDVINASGIQALKSKPSSIEISENVAGGVFDIILSSGTKHNQTLLLYGGDPSPTPVKVGSRTLAFFLRKKKIILPLSLTLVDFRMKFYPNSKIPKSYESTVAVKTKGGVERNVVISMNKPLRYADLTFFQSSYFIAKDGTEYTILAVVKNFGRLLPYFSSIIIFLGMVIHFLMMFINRRSPIPGKENH
jgi:hypothetical protein